VEVSKSLIRRALGDRIATHFELAPELWPVRVDSGQVQQILLNLALNARDAIPQGGSLSLRAQNTVLTPTEANARNERAGEYVALRVIDSGTGMDEATRMRVFEPFFTTKPIGAGTGLGLAMVFGSMKQCGGFVEVASRPGAGATFTLWFPRAAEAPAPPAAAISGPPRASGSVLLVEDNPAVANVAKLILESAGYAVLVTQDAERALDMWRAAPADVLITDIEMPGMSGMRLAERLREFTPNLRTLFITGHSNEQIEETAGRSAVVMKPFRRQELLVAVAKLLERI
jgi:CheY-like chemotaxis protein